MKMAMRSYLEALVSSTGCKILPVTAVIQVYQTGEQTPGRENPFLRPGLIVFKALRLEDGLDGKYEH